ncbi:MAG: MFS transporter [Caryophanon sp.]|nr:MFS transporter [Caryophanon sp.]
MTHTNHSSSKTSTTAVLLFVISVIFIAMTLRTPLTAVGPVIPLLRDDLGISNVLAGFLTTIPLLAFAIISPFVARIARKFSIERTLLFALFILATGILLRAFTSINGVIIGTFFIGVAISFGNVLMPSYLKLRMPLKVGLMMGIYSVSMNISAGIAAGISYPLAETTFGWRGAVSFAIVFVIIAIICWLPQLTFRAQLHTPTTKAQLPLYKSPLVWAIACMMGIQSLLFYSSSAWFPAILMAQGFSASEAGWLSSVMLFAQLPMTFFIPILASKATLHVPITIGFSTLYIVGFLGLTFEWTAFAAVWMICIGLAGGASFSLVMMLFTMRTESIFTSAELSGFAQSTGYLLAAIGPVTFGWLHDATDSWFATCIAFLACAIVLFISGLYGSRNRTVEQSLQGR